MVSPALSSNFFSSFSLACNHASVASQFSRSQQHSGKSSGGSGVAPLEKDAKALVKSSMVFDARNKLDVVAVDSDSGDNDRGVAVSSVRSIEPQLCTGAVEFLMRCDPSGVTSRIVVYECVVSRSEGVRENKHVRLGEGAGGLNGNVLLYSHMNPAPRRTGVGGKQTVRALNTFSGQRLSGVRTTRHHARTL